MDEASNSWNLGMVHIVNAFRYSNGVQSASVSRSLFLFVNNLVSVAAFGSIDPWGHM